ncbi:hypothetical protein SAMN02745911_2137 [Aureimonas altamirensis DSM 21988]|uniref:DUF2470 domain-containing protein n=1 Tax=Aureimonas altamirensis DSM 21988 TaxID=1121026 RepID=A0ABY1IJA1_9HYPH|nr:DUF2470 domain-containing protein [Aureimonas altamirensis]SHJ24757.1 hypothetical protein SAMN02745911_2137 [Aureimonas altamirensis DSM 21988]
MAETQSVLQPVTDETRRQARNLVRTARHATMASLDASDGWPLASRVLVAPDITGDPVILVSTLASHAAALAADPRACLLFGTPGKGDPLAHARLSARGRAEKIDAHHADYERVRRRFLARQPKAKLYVDFPDFSFWRIALTSASLNGGFGRAHEMSRGDLTEEVEAGIVDAELRVSTHMNEDHSDATERMVHQAGGAGTGWLIGTIDRHGFDCVRADDVCRIEFDRMIDTGKDYHMAFVELARQAKSNAAPEGAA